VRDACLFLQWTGNIVKKGGRDEDSHIRILSPANLFAEMGDAEDVVETVGS
jgi:hypothetical protein